MNLGQVIGALQMRLSEYESVDGGPASILALTRVGQAAPEEKHGRAWLQARIMAFIEARGEVTSAEVQRGLGIGSAVATVTLLKLVVTDKLVRAGERMHYRYSKAPNREER